MTGPLANVIEHVLGIGALIFAMCFPDVTTHHFDTCSIMVGALPWLIHFFIAIYIYINIPRLVLGLEPHSAAHPNTAATWAMRRLGPPQLPFGLELTDVVGRTERPDVCPTFDVWMEGIDYRIL